MLLWNGKYILVYGTHSEKEYKDDLTYVVSVVQSANNNSYMQFTTLIIRPFDIAQKYTWL